MSDLHRVEVGRNLCYVEGSRIGCDCGRFVARGTAGAEQRTGEHEWRTDGRPGGERTLDPASRRPHRSGGSTGGKKHAGQFQNSHAARSAVARVGGRSRSRRGGALSAPWRAPRLRRHSRSAPAGAARRRFRAAVDLASNGDIITRRGRHLQRGRHGQQVACPCIGAGSGSTTVSGPIGGPGSTFAVGGARRRHRRLHDHARRQQHDRLEQPGPEHGRRRDAGRRRSASRCGTTLITGNRTGHRHQQLERQHDPQQRDRPTTARA